MKSTFLGIIAFGLLALCACSQCYECKTLSYIEDGSGSIIDSTELVEELCTADATVISEKEAQGARCSLN